MTSSLFLCEVAAKRVGDHLPSVGLDLLQATH
jgi:hypothetical protein